MWLSLVASSSAASTHQSLVFYSKQSFSAYFLVDQDIIITFSILLRKVAFDLSKTGALLEELPISG